MTLIGGLVAVYAPHCLVTFGGTLNATAFDKEIWQCGIRVMASGGGGPFADNDAYIAAIKTPLATWFGAAAPAAFPTQATLDFVKANSINAAGHYADSTTHFSDYSPHVTGAAAPDGTVMPDVLCLCLSWKTAKSVRKHVYATHGRIYPPNYNLLQNQAGGMRVANTAAWATKAKALLTLLSAGAAGSVPIVASGHAGEFEPITGVRVGDVIDLQRRRKSALKEVYSELAFTSA